MRRAERRPLDAPLSPRPRPRSVGYAVAAPGLYVWEASRREAAWARELAAFVRAREQAREALERH